MRTLLLILLLSVRIFAQCADRDGYLAPVKFTMPAKLTDYSGQKLFFSVSTKNAVYVSSLDVDADTQFPIGFEKDYKSGTYFIFVCETSPQKVAWVQKIRPVEVKMETKADADKRNAKIRKP